MPQLFPKFPDLPTELRQIVYSKLRLPEWIQMSRASRDALHYMERFRIGADRVVLYVEDRYGAKSININIDREYEERHKLTEEMTKSLRKELSSYVDCSCSWCTQRMGVLPYDYFFHKQPTVCHMVWESTDKLFYFMRVVKCFGFSILSEPYGGLVDTIQPCEGEGKLDCEEMCVVLHQTKSDDLQMQLNREKWSSWIEFAGAPSFCLRTPMVTHNERSLTDYSIIDGDFLKLDTVRNAETVYVFGKMNVGFNELNQLKATKIFLMVPPDSISHAEYRQFYGGKIKEWLQDPSLIVSYRFSVESPARPVGTPGYFSLVEFVGQLLRDDVQLGADFIVYEQYDCVLSREDDALCVRSKATDFVLRICDRNMTTFGAHLVRKYGDCWPQQDR